MGSIRIHAQYYVKGPYMLRLIKGPYMLRLIKGPYMLR